MWLTELTGSHRELLKAVREEWVQVGLSTAPANRDVAEHSLRCAYKAAGLPTPATIAWVDSPLAGALVAAGVMAFAEVERVSLLDPVLPAIDEDVRQQIAESVLIEVVGDVDESDLRCGVSFRLQDVRQAVNFTLTTGVYACLRSELGAQLRASTSSVPRAQLIDETIQRQVLGLLAPFGPTEWSDLLERFDEPAFPPTRMTDAAWDRSRGRHIENRSSFAGGQHHASWLGFYDFFLRLGLQSADSLAPWLGLAHSCGGEWLFRDYAILCERPVVISLDDGGRLHSQSGPAVAYPDGFAVYAWHGSLVPPEMITEPESITAAAIDATLTAPMRWPLERDLLAERRRVMIERFGADRYLRESGAELVHEDEFGGLYRKELPGDEPLCMVEVTDKSPRPDGSYERYLLRVPPEMKTAREAVAWTCGYDDADSYLPHIET